MTWRLTRLKHLAAVPITNGVGEPGTFNNPDWPRYVRTTDIAGPRALRTDVFASLPYATAAKALLRCGDIVMTAAGATVGKSMLYESDEPACYAGYLARFRAGPDVDPRFVSYWTESTPYWDQISAGKVVSTIDNFSAGKYQNLWIEIPDLDEQRAIADYLDAETARIDALVASRRRLIELLNERRSAVIADLTGGGTSEEGVAPRTRLKFVVGRPTSGNRDHSFTNNDSGIPCLRGLNIKPGWIDQANLMRISDADHREHAATVLHAGDVVIVRSGNAGAAAAVPPELDGANCVDLVIIRQSPKIEPKYLEYLLNSPQARTQAEMDVFGATLTHFNAVDIAELRLFIPSVREQDGLVSMLDEGTSRIDSASEAMQRQVGTLLERRHALITAAVTGQIEIPGVAA